MCFMCGDPFDVSLPLAPLLNHQCCYVTSDEYPTITLETYLDTSKRRVEVRVAHAYTHTHTRGGGGGGDTRISSCMLLDKTEKEHLACNWSHTSLTYHTHVRTHTHTHIPHARMHTHTRVHTHTHTHTQHALSHTRTRDDWFQ